MDATWMVTVAMAGFVLSHLALGLPPLRPRLIEALGESRFLALFSALAALSLFAVAFGLATSVLEPREPAAPSPAYVRLTVGLISGSGFVLALLGLMHYPRSPMALFRTQIRPASGVQLITRHPFFVGFAIWALAHASIASTGATCVFFISIGLFSLSGALIQDWKLAKKWGAPYRDYCQRTSFLPFVAMVRDRRWPRAISKSLLIALPICFSLALAHQWTSALNGAVFVGAIACGGVFVSVRRWRLGKAKQATAAEP
jgi:uncharacterized membrane protein